MEQLTFENEIIQYRDVFKRFLKEDEKSPLTNEQKKTVNLQFFPPSEKYKIIGQLEEFPKKREKEMVDKEGFPKKFLRFGKLRFEIDGVNCTMEIFRDLGDESYIAPFNDLTSGKETYGSGRFVEPEKIEANSFSIDFNKAYNPYCAYNPQRSCPMPYSRNRLPVSIDAGEKIPEK